MNKNKTKIIKLLILFVILCIISLAIFISIPLIKTLNNPEQFRDYIETFGGLAPLVFVLLCISQILIPIIPGEPMEIVGGYAFGTIGGALLCIFGESLASILVILLVKKYGRKLVLFFFNENKLDSLKFLQDEKRSRILITILFLMPGTPKDLLCYGVGLTNIDTKTLLIISTVCRLPSIVTSTLMGSGLNNQSYLFTIVVFVITSILSILGIQFFNMLKK